VRSTYGRWAEGAGRRVRQVRCGCADGGRSPDTGGGRRVRGGGDSAACQPDTSPEPTISIGQALECVCVGAGWTFRHNVRA
jgi:hypothetical protein